MCHTISIVAHRMKTFNIRQVRAALSRLEKIVSEEGEILVTRRGRVVARLLPVRRGEAVPSHADLRGKMKRLKVGSEVYVRRDRDGR